MNAPRTRNPEQLEAFRIRSEMRMAMIEFLNGQLDLAITFATLAIRAKTGEQMSSYVECAKAAYKVVFRFFERVSAPAADYDVMVNKLVRLSDRMMALGEHIEGFGSEKIRFSLLEFPVTSTIHEKRKGDLNY